MSNDSARPNTVMVTENGPLICEGALVVTSGDGTVLREGEKVALCRCGASGNKPFCDGSHRGAEFQDTGLWSDDKAVAEVAPGTLHLKPAANGPILIDGPVMVQGADGVVRFAGERGAMCRCGHSATKPWCDGSHKRSGFEAD